MLILSGGTALSRFHPSTMHNHSSPQQKGNPIAYLIVILGILGLGGFTAITTVALSPIPSLLLPPSFLKLLLERRILQSPLAVSRAEERPVPLDLDGDHQSDIVSASTKWSTVSFQIIYSKTNSAQTLSLSGAVPLVGDYDGDGLTDLATAGPGSGLRTWRIRYSATGIQESFRFSLGRGAILGGCRIFSPRRDAVAIVQGRIVRARDPYTNEERSIYPRGLRNSTIAGCIDLDGDGYDELLYRARGSNPGQTALVALRLQTGRRFFSRSMKPFEGVFPVLRAIEGTPLIALLRTNRDNSASVELQTPKGASSLEQVPASRNSKMLGWTTQRSDGTDSDAILWSLASGTIMRRYLDEDEVLPDDAIGTLDQGYELVSGKFVALNR